MSEQAIVTQGLVKHYRKLVAVSGLEMHVPRGAVYGFLGRNGAGKTTTIKMLMGLTRPSRVAPCSYLHITWLKSSTFATGWASWTKAACCSKRGSTISASTTVW